MSEHVTLVSGVRLRAGTEPEHRALHDTAVETARACFGLVRDELVPAVPGVQDETVALLTFATRANLDDWLRSPERESTLRHMAALAETDRSLTVLSGFPAWFAPAGAGVPLRWKQAVVVILGLIPVSFAVNTVRGLIAPDLALPAVVVVNAISNVCALTWLVMPRLNRLFSPWLSR